MIPYLYMLMSHFVIESSLPSSSVLLPRPKLIISTSVKKVHQLESAAAVEDIPHICHLNCCKMKESRVYGIIK